MSWTVEPFTSLVVYHSMGGLGCCVGLFAPCRAAERETLVALECPRCTYGAVATETRR